MAINREPTEFTTPKGRVLARLKVTQRENEEQVPTEVIAQSIKEISDGMRKLRTGRLNDRAIVTLLHETTKISRTDIKTVLDGLEELEGTFLKKKT